MGAFAKHRDYAIAQCCAGDAEMNAREADRGEDQGKNRRFTVPFQCKSISRVLAIMRRFCRLVTSASLFRYSVTSRTRLVLSGGGNLMSVLKSLWVEWPRSPVGKT